MRRRTLTMTAPSVQLGFGIGWRPELALAIQRRADLTFVEITTENFDTNRPLPAALKQLNVKIVPHGVSLSLGSAEPIERKRVDFLARMADMTNAPIVSEHIAFVRAGGTEAGHLLPIPRTRESLDVLVENVNYAKRLLPVPLALENISALVEWPDAAFSEAEFVAEVLERTDCLLLLDIANLWANAHNFGRNALVELEKLPLARLAYVHVGGGYERDGVYYDTHAHSAPQGAIDLLEELCARVNPSGVMLERDDEFPPPDQLNRELDAIAAAVARGAARRESAHVG